MEMIVIHDFNGTPFENSYSVERFLYQLKSIAARNEVIVFAIYNLNIPKRMDKHPMLRDFPSESYYRLFDIIQLLYKSDMLDVDDCKDKDKLEVIVVKGL